MGQKMDIFKPGTFTDMHGRVIQFTEADLLATARAYDPAISEAPLVIGHPTHDAPAYGWVKGLEFADQSLLADNDQVDADFAEMVKAGKFKKRSASFYLPDAPNNPVPGVYYLRHIGFLGAMPPAVKGLKPASFSAGDAGTVAFMDWDDMTIARLFRSMRDWMIGKFGLDEADKVIPDWSVTDLQTSAATKDDETGAPLCCAEQEETMKTRIIALEAALATANQTIANFQEQVAAKDTRIATLVTEIGGIRKEQRQADFAAFCDSLPTKISPVLRPVVMATMERLADADPVEFGEGDNKTSKPALQAYQEELKGLPDVVAFGEQATRDKTRVQGGKDSAADFGENVDEERLGLHNQALAYMEGHKESDYKTALAFVIKEGK